MQIENNIRCKYDISAAFSVVCGVNSLDDGIVFSAVKVGLDFVEVLVAHRIRCRQQNGEQGNAHLDVFLSVADDPVAVVGFRVSIDIELKSAQSILRCSTLNIDFLMKYAGRACAVEVLYTGGNRG